MTPSDIDPVWWPETPFEDESMLGFCVRTMAENLLPHLPAFLAQAGQKHRNRHVDLLRGDADPAVLATVLGVAPDVLARMRGDPAGEDVLHRGVALARADLCARIRRFAPGTLRQEPVHRADWCIRILPYCPESLEILQADCVCGERQGWTTTRAPDLCQECGEPLSAVPTIPTDPADAPALRAYAALLSGDPEARRVAVAGLPPVLSMLAPGDLIEVVLSLVPMLEPPIRRVRSERCWLAQARPFTAAIARAWRALPDWPESVVRDLLGMADPQTVEPRTPVLLRLGRLLTSDDPARTPAASAAIAAAAHEISSPGPGTDLGIDFLEAQGPLRLTASTIRAARRAGTIPTVFVLRRGELLPMLDRASVEERADRAFVGAAIIGRDLYLPRYAVEQLAAGGLVAADRHRISTRRPGLFVEEASVSDLVAALDAAARWPEGELLSLSSAMAMVGGREKPYLATFRALLDGGIPFAMRSPGPPLTRRLLVRRDDLPTIVSLHEATVPFYDHYVLDDARSVLNLHARDAAALTPFQAGRLRAATLFNRETILDLARLHVGLAELSLRLGMHHAKVCARLRASIVPESAFGWLREVAEDHLGLPRSVRTDARS